MADRVSEEDIKLMQKLRDAGESYRGIARKIGRDVNTVRYHLNPLVRDRMLEYSKTYAKDNKEKIAKNMREWQKANPEKVRAASKAYREANAAELKEKKRIYRENNKDIIKEQKRVWYKENREKANEMYRNWYAANLEREREKARAYRAEHEEEVKEYQRIYRENNKEASAKYHCAYHLANSEKHAEYQAEYRKANRDKARAYVRNRLDNDVQYRLSMGLRSRMRQAIKNGYKSGSAVNDLGCSINELKVYLESLFEIGMTWGNWALDGWHLDHIKPLAAFDLTDRDQFLEACHYTNLQPLWAKDNLRKGAKILDISDMPKETREK